MKKEMILRNLKKIVQVKNETFFTQDLDKFCAKVDEKELNQALISDIDLTIDIFNRINQKTLKSEVLTYFMSICPSNKLYDLILSHHGFNLNERISINIFSSEVPWNGFFNYIAGNVLILENVLDLMMDHFCLPSLVFSTDNTRCFYIGGAGIEFEGHYGSEYSKLIELVNIISTELEGKKEYDNLVNKLYDNLFFILKQVSPDGDFYSDGDHDVFVSHLKDYLRLVPVDKQRGDTFPITWCSDYFTITYQLYSIVVSLDKANKNELAIQLEKELFWFKPNEAPEEFPIRGICNVLSTFVEIDKDTGEKIMSIVKHLILNCILINMMLPRNEIFSKYKSFEGTYDSRKLYLESVLNDYSSKIHYFDSQSNEFIPFAEQVILAGYDYDHNKAIPYISGLEDEYSIFLAFVPEKYYSKDYESEILIDNSVDCPVMQWEGEVNTKEITCQFLDIVSDVEKPGTLSTFAGDVFSLLRDRARKYKKVNALF